MISRAIIRGRVEFERIFSPLEGRLQQLYQDMDRSYQQVAHAYGFFCTGCETSCCETRFYHHTLAEYCFLHKGFLGLDSYQRQEITVHATAVLKAYRTADERQKSIRIPCPLHQDGRCLIYPYRPMICRLHGIPHELRGREGKIIHGPGCDLFHRQYGDAPYKQFDRTLFYQQMAALEQALRQSIGVYDKFKMTIAEMLILERDIAP